MMSLSTSTCQMCLVAYSCLTLCDPMDYSLPGSSVHENSPGKNTGMGCHAFLQGIFPTQGSNPGLPHCRQILHHLSHQGSPRILECVAYPFSRGHFLTQESNQGLLHCRQILYQLSCQGSPSASQPPSSADSTLLLLLLLLSRISRVHVCATLWTVASQAPLSMGFSRQEYWSRLP